MDDERDELDEVLERAHASALTPERRAYGKDLITRARSIRARERKLAELAREAYERDAQRRRMTTSWIRRYEEAVK